MVLGAAIVTGITSVVSGSARPAGADQISSAKAQAAQVNAQIQAANAHIDQLSQQYDAATYHLQQVNAQIAAGKQQLAKDQQQVVQDHTKLRKQAVNAYMTAGTSTPLSQYFSTNGSAAGISNEYTSIADGNVTTTIDQLHTAQNQLQTEQQVLTHQQQQAAADQASIATARSQANALVAQEQSTLNGLDAHIHQLVIQQQQAQQAAAQAAARAAYQAQMAAAQAAQAAQQAAAQNQGAQSSGPAPGSVVPPVSQNAAGAVAAAESQIGVPYQWGAEDPGVAFDCSGLTAWAWGQAGHPLPHYSGAQYDETVRIPLADMQPGDLLFYGPGGSEHVAMYVGGGMMIEAPHTGASVWVTPVRTGYGFVGVGRVE